ncbi:hypothetical protein WG66_008317 [Moniliophthora roreri]|nr:hypothetical protein WG66_008317 [Moniliophthora roreri]
MVLGDPSRRPSRYESAPSSLRANVEISCHGCLSISSRLFFSRTIRYRGFPPLPHFALGGGVEILHVKTSFVTTRPSSALVHNAASPLSPFTIFRHPILAQPKGHS